MPAAAIDFELRANRRMTLAFIARNPYSIKIHRKLQVVNDRAGVDENEEDLDAQIMTILHNPPRRRARENSAPNQTMGEIPFTNNMLMSRWDSDVKKGDTFEADGIDYRITFVFADRRWETICNIQSTDLPDG